MAVSPANSATGAPPEPYLRAFSGQLLLVGAGKMGGALLEGWLRLGLDPRRVAALEAQPSPQITALAARGVRLNPEPQTLRDLTAAVIALKPQIAPEVIPAVAPLVSAETVVV